MSARVAGPGLSLTPWSSSKHLPTCTPADCCHVRSSTVRRPSCPSRRCSARCCSAVQPWRAADRGMRVGRCFGADDRSPAALSPWARYRSPTSTSIASTLSPRPRHGGVSDMVLSQPLRRLPERDLVARDHRPDEPGSRCSATYRLTPLGESFANGPPATLARWAADNQTEFANTSPTS